MEQKKLYQHAYILLFEAGLKMLKLTRKNFIFTTLYEPYMPNRDANIARHNNFKRIITQLGFTYIEFNIRWRIQDSRKWYKEQAILIGCTRAEYLTELLRKKGGLPNDGIILLGKNLTHKGTFLLKTADDENAVIYCNGDIKTTELCTPDAIFNFYNKLRGQQVQFLSFGYDNCGKETGPSGFISAMYWIPRRYELMARIAEGKEV